MERNAYQSPAQIVAVSFWVGLHPTEFATFLPATLLQKNPDM